MGGRREALARMSYDLLSREGENEVGYGYERNIEDLIIFYLAELIEDVIYYLKEGCNIRLPDSMLKRVVEEGLNSGRSSEEMAHLLHCLQSLGNNKGHCFECNHPKKKIRFTCSRCEAKFCNEHCMRYHMSSDCVCDQIIIFRLIIEEQRNNGSTAETEERGEVCVGEGNV